MEGGRCSGSDWKYMSNEIGLKGIIVEVGDSLYVQLSLLLYIFAIFHNKMLKAKTYCIML